MLCYPWSSLPWYFAAPAHRPSWIHVERLLGAHGIQEDSPKGRLEFEQRMEARRQVEAEDAEWEALEKDWCLGSDEFKAAMLAHVEDKLGENHVGDLKQLSAEAKAERIIAEELRRAGWTEVDLALRHKRDPAKLALASRLRTETILPITWIARRLHLGTPKSARPRLRAWARHHALQPTTHKSIENTELLTVALL